MNIWTDGYQAPAAMNSQDLTDLAEAITVQGW